MAVHKVPSAIARWCSATVTLGGALVLVGAGWFGETSPAFAQSGELAGVIFLDDVPGFVGPADADTVVACLPSGECVTGDGNVLTGFRPAVWPNLRLVDDDLVIESDVDVQATAFGRILAREGTIAETFASTAGKAVVVSSPEFETTSVRVPDPLNGSWADNNFNNTNGFWITYDEEGSPKISPANGTEMTVSETFSVPLGTTGDVDGFVFADDTARVVIKQDGDAVGQLVFDFNNTQDGACADGPIGCEDGEQGDLSLGNNSPLDLNNLPSGDYLLEFTARQDGGGPFGLQYAFEVTLDVVTLADVCWTFDEGIPGEKVCVAIAAIAECDDCGSLPVQCPTGGDAITLTSGDAGDTICDDLATQFFEDGVTEVLEEFQFVVGFDVPATSQPGSVRIATCTIDDTEVTYVPICRNPASKVLNATVNNDLPLSAVETPRCVKISGKTYC